MNCPSLHLAIELGGKLLITVHSCQVAICGSGCVTLKCGTQKSGTCQKEKLKSPILDYIYQSSGTILKEVFLPE